MAAKIVNVSVSGKSLSFSPSNVDLDDGDQVVWVFPDLPSSQYGFVFFTPRLGPFHSLRSFGNTKILGKGNIGSAGNNPIYTYTGMILELGADEPVATGTGTVNNRATLVNTTPDVLVIYNPPVNGGQATLTVEPCVLALNPDDTATWSFIDLPDGAFGSFHFYPETPGLDASTGPFVAFCACNSSNVVSVLANGIGFLSNSRSADWAAQYRYCIEVRGSNGELLASHEPVIDNLGPPPGAQETA